MREKVLVERLIELGLSISSAESLTGGMFASKIVSVPDASKVLGASFVTYSNEAKEKFCGVNSETIKKCGVVSREVALEMAAGVRRACGSNIGVSFTGIAGPGGGTKKTPVGTVCIAANINGEAQSFEMHFDGDRQSVREQSVDFAIEKLIELLEKF